MLAAPRPQAGPLRGCSASPGSDGGTDSGAQHHLGTFPCPRQPALLCWWLGHRVPSPAACSQPSLGPSKTPNPSFSDPGGFPQPPQVLSQRRAPQLGDHGGSRDPPWGVFGGKGGANVTQHPLGATCVSPRGSQPTLGFCIAATAKQVLLGYKKALGGGQAGSRAAGIHARALAVATGLHVRANNAICPGIAAQRTPQQRPKPQTRGHGAELASQRLPERSRAAPRTRSPSRTRPCQTAERGTGTGTASPSSPSSQDPGPERCWAGRQGRPCQPPSPHAGQIFCRCHSALPSSRVSSDFLLILRQRGGEASWNQHRRWGCFLGKQKQRGSVPRPRRCSGLEELRADRVPSLAAVSV